MLSAVRLHQAVLAAALLVPALVFGAAAWWNRGEVLGDGADVVERTTAVMHEHVAKVFETADLILDRAEDHLRGLPPEVAVGPGTSEFLSRMKAPLDHIVSIWVSDASGHVLAGTQAWDRSVTIGDREFFRVHRDSAERGTHVSAAFSGRATTLASFAISRRRSDAAGAFAGVIHVSFSPDYFVGFFADIAPPFAHSAGLFRADGAILAREPEAAAGVDRLGPGSPVLQRIARQPARGRLTDVSSLDGEDRIYAYRKVGHWPVYVAFGTNTRSLLGRWRGNLVGYGLVAGAAALTLLVVAFLALRQARAAEAAEAALRREAAARAAAEARQAAEARFRAVFESRAVGMSVFDLHSGETLIANDRLLEMTGGTRALFAARRWDWRAVTPPDQLVRDEAAVRQALCQGWWDPYEKDYLPPGGSRLPVRVSSAPMPGEPGRVVVLVQDISEQRVAELRRDLLMREVDHRAKNALATARAALRLTQAPSLEAFVREVDGRIGALAQALLLLSTTQWTGGDLRLLVEGELKPFLGKTGRAGEPTAALCGPEVMIAATAVQPLAMAVHELATNATKYGALSALDGRLKLAWSVEGDWLRLVWQERGGPAVVAPAVSGFGTRVLRTTVAQQLGGRLTLDWDPAGLTCEIELPVARALAAHAPREAVPEVMAELR